MLQDNDLLKSLFVYISGL